MERSCGSGSILTATLFVHSRKICDAARYLIFSVAGSCASSLLHPKAESMTVFDYKNI